MSDLQLSLLIIAVIVVGGVVAYNWFQQWRLRRRMDEGFARERKDAPAREAAARIEPQLGAAPPPRPAPAERVERTPAAASPPVRAATEQTPAPQPLPSVPGFDPAFDYVVSIDAQVPLDAAAVNELHTRAAACGRRFRMAGYDERAAAWEESTRLTGGRYAHVKLALQLVNRGGVVDAAALGALCAAAQECARRSGATAACPDIEAALVQAQELDRFCGDVDVAVGFNIVANGEKFEGTRIRTLAEAAGFKLEPDGLFHYRDSTQRTLFTLDNHEPAPFLPEQVKQLTTTGMTLLLDVPRVTDAPAALELMLKIGRELAQALGGALVDDNRVPLTDGAVHAIGQQLKDIHGTMEERGVPPGGERALRLFS